jgi:hypothetical protein
MFLCSRFQTKMSYEQTVTAMLTVFQEKITQM